LSPSTLTQSSIKELGNEGTSTSTRNDGLEIASKPTFYYVFAAFLRSRLKISMMSEIIKFIILLLIGKKSSMLNVFVGWPFRMYEQNQVDCMYIACLYVQ